MLRFNKRQGESFLIGAAVVHVGKVKDNGSVELIVDAPPAMPVVFKASNEDLKRRRGPRIGFSPKTKP